MDSQPELLDAEHEVETVCQIGYASAAASPFDDEELVELLAKARKNNAVLGETGMLLYHEGSFLQVLEGEQAVVEELYARITEDPRHTDALLLFRRSERERGFGQWTMGFHRIDGDAVDPPEGLNRFLQTGATGISTDDAEQLRQVLLGFRGGRWRRRVDH